MLEIITGAFVFAIGVFSGAFLMHRKRTGQNPLSPFDYSHDGDTIDTEGEPIPPERLERI